MVVLMLLFHLTHILNGYTMVVVIAVPGGAAGLVVRALARPPDRSSTLPPEDRPAHPRKWNLWNTWLGR
jgi:hypothetical protein